MDKETLKKAKKMEQELLIIKNILDGVNKGVTNIELNTSNGNLQSGMVTLRCDLRIDLPGDIHESHKMIIGNSPWEKIGIIDCEHALIAIKDYYEIRRDTLRAEFAAL